MRVRSTPYTVPLQFFSRAAAIMAICVSILVLAGWVFDIPSLRSILTNTAPTKVNTAFGLFCAGISLWLFLDPRSEPRWKLLRQILPLLLVLTGSLTLVEYLFRWDLGLDRLLASLLPASTRAFHNRISFVTALSLTFIGFSLLWFDSKRSQYLSLSVTALSLVAVVGYLYDYQTLYLLPGYGSMALPTALTFLFLSLGIPAAQPGLGIMKVFTSNVTAGRTALVMLPVTILLILLLGFVVEEAEHLGIIDTGYESVVLVLLLILFFSPLIYFYAQRINESEMRNISLGRLYATLSQVNQTIVRAKSQQELFESICRVAVKFGEFHLAWVGLYDPETGQLVPAAEYSDEQTKLPFQDINLNLPPFRDGLIGLSARLGLVQTSNDIQADPRMAHWQEFAARDGYHSAAAVPIRQGGQIVGFLNLYATDIDFFIVKEEQSLLEKMGLDISFALEMMAKEAERKRAEEEIRSRSRQLAILLEASQSLTGSLRLVEVLQRITDHSVDILGVQTAAIYQVVGEHLYMGASTPPLPSDVPETLRRAALVDHPHIAQALSSGQPVILSDADSALLTPAEQVVVNALGLRTILYIPLAAQKNAEGILILGSFRTTKEFSPEEKDLARALSNQAALAVANAKLYEDLAGYVQELENQITERKQAEEALLENEERLRLSLQAAKQGLYDLNVQTGEAVVNREYAQMLGYDPDTFVETNAAWIERLHPDDREITAQAYSDYISGLLPQYRVEFRQRTKDDDWKWILSLGKLIEYDAEGKPLRMLGTHTDITERKRVEEELRNSQALMSGIFDSAMDAIISTTADQRILMFNPAAEAMFRCSQHEAIGELLDRFIPLRFREQHRLKVQNFAQTGETSRSMGQLGTIYGLRSDGEEFPIEASISKTSIPGNDLYTVILRDVTERKLAEEALRASEERFRLLFENNHTVMMLLEPVSGAIRNANQAAAEFYGYPLPQLCMMNINQINALPLADEYAERMRVLKQEKNYFHFQHRLSNGKIRSVEVHSAPVEVSGETLLFSIVYDITDRKQSEEKLRRHVGYLTGLREVDQAIVSSFDVRLSLNIITSRAVPLLNVDAAAILLLDPIMNTLEYVAGHGFQKNILHTGSIRLGESFAGKAVLERRMIQVSNLSLDLQGQFHNQLFEEKIISYYGIPLIVKGKVVGVMEIFHRSLVERDQEWFDFLDSLAGQAAIAIDNSRLWEQVQRHARDLELRVAERTAALNRTNVELEHASRAKDEFLANMSHELRTPLNSILGLSESLLEQRRDPLTEYQQKSLEIISSSGHHLLELINDVLDLAKIEAGKFDHYPQTVNVDSLCRSSLAFVKSQALKKSITVLYENEASASNIFADPRRLKQSLVNLLTNAVKFTPEGGRVTLRVCADAEQDIVEFSVLDNGIGIALHDLKRLFQPFVQVDSKLNRQFEGTGLGLALVQKLIDMHGGSVHVESEVGSGSRFTIRLPWGQKLIAQQTSDASNAGPTGKSNEPAEIPSARGLVLLAEDNPANILTIGEYLESHGYSFVQAHDGSEAIEKAQTSNPDVILMDIQMPVMDGLEAIRRLRKDPRFSVTPIIAITALAMPGDRERCLEAGANEYMSKPVRLKSLKQTIEDLLGDRSVH